MQKLNTVLTQVLSRLGVDTTSADAQALIGNQALASIDVADSVSNRLDAEFFTIESASQNPSIRAKIRAEVLNGIDSQAEEIMTRYALDDESRTGILAEDKTSKRITKLVDTIASLQEKKHGATGKDKDVLNQEIARLNGEMVKVRADYDQKLSATESARKMDRVNWELDSIYGSLDYSLGTPKEISAVAAKAVIERLARAKGIVFDATENGVNLKTADGTDYFENNVRVTPADFIKKTLFENKMLKVSEGASAHATTPPRVTHGNAVQVDHSSFRSATQSMLNALPQQP